MIKVVLVDDTRLARKELRTLLAAHADVELLDEADDLPAARTTIAKHRPDLLLLDIQLPSGTGFDLLEQIDPLPMVIFTTAYDQYAVRAFEANALDYLVKPVDPQRLDAALKRARERLSAGSSNPGVGVTPPRLGAGDTVFLRDGERCWFVSIADITRIAVEGNYVQVWFRGERAMLARSLGAIEARLDPALFFRANRNTLVSLRAIGAIDPWVNDGYLLRLKDGSEVEVSRRQARELRERLAL